MIDKKLLMNSIKAETEELANQRVKIHKDCMNNLRDMNYSRVIMDSINLHVIEEGIRIFNDLSERMKAGRLIELLEGVSPDAEVMCCISTDDLEEVTNMTLADFNALKKYEIFVVLNSDEDEEFCRLLIKKGGY